MGFIKRFFKGVLMTATLLASMTFAGAQTGVAPNVRFLETDQALPDGLWRIRLDGDVFSIQKNTHVNNNFATEITALSVAANGDVTIPNDFFVTGSATVTVDTSVTGNLLVGATSSIGWENDVFLFRDGPWELALRDGTNDNFFYIYATFTDDMNYERLALYAGGNQDFFIEGQTAGTGQDTINLDIIAHGTLKFTPNLNQSPNNFLQFQPTSFILQPSNVINFSGARTVEARTSMTVAQAVAGPANAITIEAVNVNSPGQQDSNMLLITGKSNNGAANIDVDWLQFVDVTANDGTGSLYTWQTRLDAASFADALTVSATEVSLPATSSLDWGGDTKLFRDEPWALALRDGNNDNSFRIYANFTDLNNYERLALYAGSGQNFFIEAQTAGTGQDTVNIDIIANGTGSRVRLLPNDSGSSVIYQFTETALTFFDDNILNIGQAQSLRPANVFVGTSVQIGITKTVPDDAIILEMANRSSDGQTDSQTILWTGKSRASSINHDADWVQFVDVTSDAGASTWTLQTRIDAAGYADAMTVTDAGVLSVPTAIEVGTLPALVGKVRLADEGGIYVRQTGEDFDLRMIRVDSNGAVEVGEDNFEILLTGDNVDIPNALLLLGNTKTTPGNQLQLSIADIGSPGTRDSHNFLMRGRSDDGSAHSVEWKHFVDVTSNAGASTWTLQSRIDGAGFADRLTITDAGDANFAGGITTEGQFIIDVDDTEAFLVRLDSDGGDLFIVNTVDGNVGIGENAPNTTSLFNVNGTFTSSGAGFTAIGVLINPFIIAAQGDTTLQAEMSIRGVMQTQTEAENIQDMITLDLTGDFSVVGSATVSRTSVIGIEFIGEGSGFGSELENYAILIGYDQLGTYDAIVFEQRDRVGDGFDDSGTFIMTGKGFESATPHDIDWKQFVDVTANDGDGSIWTLQHRIDAASYVDALTITQGSSLFLMSLPRSDSSLSIGSGTATTGTIRLRTEGDIKWRNDANDADLGGITLNDSDQIVIGDGTGAGAGVSIVLASDVLAQGVITIDVDNAEALLVRANGDAGDIFFVDTVADEVEIPTGALILGLGNTAAQDSLIIDGTDLTVDGQQDSGAIILTGLTHAESPVDVDWKQFVNVTFDGGTQSIWTLQNRVNATPFVDQFTVNKVAPKVASRGDMDSSFAVAGNFNAFTANIKAGETLNSGGNLTTASWSVAGDFSDGASEVVYLHSGGSGTLTQANGDMLLTPRASRWYEIIYTVTNVTAVGNLQLSIDIGKIGVVLVPLDVSSAGAARSVRFFSATSPAGADFQVTGSSNTASDGFTLTAMAIREITGGDVNVNNAVAWGSDLFLHRDGPWELGLRDGNFDNAFYVYGAFTDQNNYERLAVYAGSVDHFIEVQTAGTGTDDINLHIEAAGSGNLILENSAGTLTLRASTSSFDFIADNVIDIGRITTARPKNVYIATTVFSGLAATSSIDALVLDSINLVSPGQRDSNSILMTGQGHDGSQHDADWSIFVDVTSNAGASLLTFQERIDASGFISTLTLSSGGIVDVPGTLTRGTTFQVDGDGILTVDAGIVMDGADLSSPGQKDSQQFLQTGNSHDGAPHDADWRQLVDVTSNAGASTWTLQSRIDAAGYVNKLTITDAGVLLADTLTLTTPLAVPQGGTGAATFTDGGLLFGQGAGTFSTLAQATNGQIPMGVTGDDPILATITGTANQITNTVGAGSSTLSIPSAFIAPGSVEVTTTLSVNGTPTPAIGASLNIQSATAILAMTSGSSVTATNLIPAGSFVVGVVTRVNDLVTGPAGYDVGDGVQVDRWGNSILVAADTTSDITDFQSSALTLFPAANDVVITTDGVDFTAGNIRVIVYYMSLTAPTVD